MKSDKKIIILSGAGISAESGLGTFRDSGGLWEQYDISEVATIDAWHRNPELVLNFYDARRAQVLETEPNQAHYALAGLERHFDVRIITQNIDNLHERAGSKKVIHLHGEILKARGVDNPNERYPIEGSIKLGDLSPSGQQLRPDVVWFGEPVPQMEIAEEIAREADIFIVVGTSLNVYPAASLQHTCPIETEKYIVDPKPPLLDRDFKHIQANASEGIPQLCDELIERFS